MNAGRPAGVLPARIGRYQILERIGKGAMGVVYSARDEMMDRIVAVKVMMADLEGEPDTRTRFYREAQAAGRLLHPNIITIFDIGEDESRIYMVMELLKGLTLSEFLRQPAVPLERKVDLMIQTCDGLSAAHAGGIVHRDIKPGNLFVLADGSLKILDFGVARLASSTMTASGFIIGTPDYMSPEQARGAEIDPRSDIFSTAAVFYYMLSGRKPFGARDLPTVLRKVQSEAPPALTEEEAPAALARLVMKSLSKAPVQRHQSMGELAADLSRFRRHYDAETRQVARSARERYDAIQSLTRERNEVLERLGMPAADEPPAAAALREQHPAFVDRAPELLLVPFTRPEIRQIGDTLAREHEALERVVEPLRHAGAAFEAAGLSLEDGRAEEAASRLETAAVDLPDTGPVRDLRTRCAEALAATRERRARLDALAAEARAAADAERWPTVMALCEDAAALGGTSDFQPLRLRAQEAIDRAARDRARAQQRALERARRAVEERRFAEAAAEIEQARAVDAPAGEIEAISERLAEAERAAEAEAAVARLAAEAVSLARAELHAGHRAAAVSALRECLAAEPHAPGVERELVRIEDEIKRLEDAELRHAEAEAHAGRAAAALAAGDLAGTVREASAALSAEPGHREAARLNATAQATLRAEADARERRVRAAEHVGRARGHLSSGSLAKAAREAQSALEQEADNAAAAAILSEVRERQAAEDAARERARILQQEIRAGRHELRAGRVDAARAAVERALAAAPGDAQATALGREVDAERERRDRVRQEKEDDTVAAAPAASRDEDDTVNGPGVSALVGGVVARVAARLRRLVRR
jgi:eukaryotic-like serine/threonine-protein kinase